MIKVEQLTKSFGDFAVLKGIDAEIHKGEVVSIIGPSGTGKSTFLRCLNLLDTPSSGRIEVDGVDILGQPVEIARVRQKMNMVFQSFNLFAHLSVLDNLVLAPMKLKGVPRAQAEEKAVELLRLVGLAEKKNNFPDELSGGQKQRVAIARCLAMEPEVILFDEPTSALDPTMIGEVLAVIRNLAKEGLTMVIVTHEMDFARDVSSRIFYMDQGVIYEEGAPDEIFSRPQKPKTIEFINRIKKCTYRISSPDYDLYELNSVIEVFCERSYISHRVISKVQLLVEETLHLCKEYIDRGTLDISVMFSERSGTVEVTISGDAGFTDPIANSGDELEAIVIRNMTDKIEFMRSKTEGHLKLTLPAAAAVK